jgi:hypothetical protein
MAAQVLEHPERPAKQGDWSALTMPKQRNTFPYLLLYSHTKNLAGYMVYDWLHSRWLIPVFVRNS